ncbi:ABC transporter ATP-binding protein [Demequina flava]|uniref:ABC transporter ATP-binding protein n=1 Tax=Demequina flava TaxID=1095025 RepID=UPI00078515C5|nr:ABC transporter ATP-binding protein [Demequina flava]
MTTAITLQAVSKEFKRHPVPALRGIDLDILPGTRTALLGPSGSGKSTILRIIAGLEDPSGGQVLIDGRDVTGVLPERRGVGMVFQRSLLFPHLSVLDNVAFPLRAAGASRRAARAAAVPYLDLVQLPDYADRNVASLSGGQQQRVAIARTLAARPTVLLLDEPFSALDPDLRADMHGLLAELRTELPPTIVMVTHDRDEAAAVADRIAVVESGVVLQHDTVERIYSRPSCQAVARLMGGRNAVLGVVSGAVHSSDLGQVAVPESAPEGPGVLVVRHESVQLLGRGAAAAHPGEVYTGTVAQVTRNGARRSVTLSRGNAAIEADVPPGVDVSEGSTVVFSFVDGAPSVVPIEAHAAPGQS